MDGNDLMAEAGELARGGWRLALINATAVLPEAGAEEGAVELCWSFERGGRLVHLRRRVAHGEAVPSLSGLYGSAFLYENEIRELFGVEVTGLLVDFKGELYRTSTRVPLSGRAIKARLAARGKAS
jgi:ech hydrogenase subunit D